MEKSGSGDYFQRHQQPISNPQPEDYELAKLFMGSPDATEISHLQRSLSAIIERERTGSNGEKGQVREPTAVERQDVVDHFEKELSLTVREMIQNGAVYGTSEIASILVLDRQLIFNPDKPTWPIISLVAELRDRQANSFVLSTTGLHQVRGPAFLRISGYPDAAETFEYEVLLSETGFADQKQKLDDVIRGARAGSPFETYTGALLADVIREDTPSKNFSTEDLLSIRNQGDTRDIGTIYEVLDNSGNIYSVVLNYNATAGILETSVQSSGGSQS